jgi:phosphoglycolate phosphatase
MIKAVIFDFDLTLVDSVKGVVICAIKTLSNMGIKNIDKKKIIKSIGMTLEDSFAYFSGIDDRQKASEYKSIYISNADNIFTNNTKWMKGAKELILFLKDKNIKTGIVSTKIRRRLFHFLDAEKMTDRFDIIVGGDDVLKNKPDPESLEKAVNVLGMPKGNVLYAGDSLIDQDTAYNCGIRFAAVLTGHTKKNEFDDKKVEYFFSNILEIKKII